MRSSRGPSGPKEFGYSAISRSTGGSYPVARGAVAEWLGRGLQSLVHQFESGRRLSALLGLELEMRADGCVDDQVADRQRRRQREQRSDEPRVTERALQVRRDH